MTDLWIFLRMERRGEQMIPKVIHYCWFGGNPLPELALKCIDSWKNFFTDYEIKEWNESNFDLTSCDYIKEAYQAKKWAFVSDYARFKILYEFGGLYFDTDVEVIKNMDDIINNGPFMGTEPTTFVTAGLGLAANSGLGLYKEILDFYGTIHFILPNGQLNEHTVVEYVTEILKKHGYKPSAGITKVNDIIIYPAEYFCPQNYDTGVLTITDNTRSIHHYSATWHSKLDDMVAKIEKCKNRNGIEFKIRRCVSFPFRFVNKIDKLGWKKTINFTWKKLIRCKN